MYDPDRRYWLVCNIEEFSQEECLLINKLSNNAVLAEEFINIEINERHKEIGLFTGPFDYSIDLLCEHETMVGLIKLYAIMPELALMEAVAVLKNMLGVRE